jgi:ketosteroid isomerase-like protein
MSQENVDVVMRYIDAWNRRDLDAVMEMLDPKFEIDLSRSRAPYQGVYRGPTEARSRLDDMWETWEKIHLDLESGEFIESGDQVVAVVPAHLRGRETGIELTGTAALVCTVRNRKIVRHQVWQGRTEALEAVGLSEQDAQADS